MAKPKEKDPTPEMGSDQKALVLFGGVQEMLPAELAELGLTTDHVEAQEIPGVAPSWRPVERGDFLLGRCIDKRKKIFDPGTKEEREATVLVFETAVPGGFRSLWLGTDLEIKLSDPVGKVYQVYYEGESRPSARSQKLNPMKTYRVMEIRPKAGMIPETINLPTE